MLRVADVAKYFGKKCVTVIEFGVASGAGLLNMADVAPLIEEETGVKLRIAGFDTG
jgi:tRNA G46 methylase TrmB